MATNRTHRAMEGTIVRLASIIPEEIVLIQVTGVNYGSDLSILRFKDITDILPKSSIVKRRKLEYISKYIGRG